MIKNHGNTTILTHILEIIFEMSVILTKKFSAIAELRELKLLVFLNFATLKQSCFDFKKFTLQMSNRSVIIGSKINMTNIVLT